MMAAKELAPVEDQGFAFTLVEAAADATIDQTAHYTDELRKELGIE
jgi:multidrug efflux pump subunit AcrB